MASWIILLPLLSALINGLFCKKIGKTFAGLISCALMLTATVIAIITFYAVAIHHQEQYLKFFTWLKIANLHVSWGMYLDVVSASMLLMISLISTLIHIYSLGYMSEDENLPRFMSYLSLFTFFMMVLISADNFLQLFVGWEGVGLCSYLLIGFWYHKEAANKAAMKAFIVNRVGDVGYVLGIISIYYVFNSLEFAEVFAAVSTKQYLNVNFLGIELSAINLICMLLFIGAMGKSAQICLHTWLPDAMEGPTPVSALIHAATMVTAGVFLIVRCSPLFAYALEVNNIIMLVGSLTCLFAAFVALSQTDIKKIIAYSTCSQLGYMFFACGAGAYDAGLFHLLTHAFLKPYCF
jgi:NADH-quinone oxidoreductase subunit L